LRFSALAPRMMPDTELGKYAVARYSRYLGISAADFIQGMPSPAHPMSRPDLSWNVSIPPATVPLRAKPVSIT
jgi:hypothetical protein